MVQAILLFGIIVIIIIISISQEFCPESFSGDLIC